MGRVEEAWQDEQGRCHEGLHRNTQQEIPGLERQAQTLIISVDLYKIISIR